MKKIYCKNCKYKWYDGTGFWCWRKVKYKDKTTDVQATNNTEMNSNNNCPYYKKKWYLFWIK